MNPIEVSQISKSFGSLKAVDNVTFDVGKGEIFGLLGPNGAGKTTIIRVILDVFKPDQGEVSILGGPMSESKKDRIGYMPEERGLYQDIKLERCLKYLASLKGLSSTEINTRLDDYLERFDLADHKNKKVKELSKGMQQKAQIIATLIHEPEIIIVDEPFSGLDPVNTQMVKDLLRDVHRQGTSIIMSTHQMHQVEELCDRILLINHGQTMLYGKLEEIQNRFSGHAVLVRSQEKLPAIPGVVNIESNNSTDKLILDRETQPQDILRSLIDQGVTVEKFEIAVPALDEIFIQVVQDQEDTAA